MGTRFPLGIRIFDGRTDRHVGAQASNLRWSRTASGGFHSLSVSLNIDPALFPDLGPADRIWVYGPDGRVLFEGFLDNPGKSASESGIGLDLSAMGTVILASDQTVPLIYIDRDLSGWDEQLASTAATSSTSTVSDDPTSASGGDTPQGLLTQLNPGQAVGTNSAARIGYETLATAGMTLGAVGWTVKSGKTDANYRSELVYSSGVGTTATAATGTISTTPASTTRYVDVGGSFPSGTTRLAFQLRRSGAATNVADDDTWSWFSAVSVVARRMNAAGTLLSATELQAQGGPVSVRADYVVADLIGRLMSFVDKQTAIIEPGSFLIDQLAFPDGVTASDVLDELSTFEPDMLWEMLENTGSGYRFNYRAWPTTVRYEVSYRDGYEAPGGDVDLCNRVAVKWVDPKGKDRVTIVTAASALPATVAGVAATVQAPALSALEAVGRIRDAEEIALPEGRGSAANAQRAGEQLLAQKATPPKAATCTVRRPIADLLRGGWAVPYEIEPGYLVRVRETGDVLRLTEVEVDDEEGAAVLTLGEPVLTEEQRLARLEYVTRRRVA